MAEREQLKAAARPEWAVVRRRPKLSITAFVIIFLLVVPVWPYFPSCDINPPSSRTQRLCVRMSDEYRELVKYGFHMLGVYYRDIGGVVLIRALPFLDGDPLFEQHDAILNSEQGAAGYLVSKACEGGVIAGQVYRIPACLRELLNANPGHRIYERCDIMRVIVTGKPPRSGAERQVAARQRARERAAVTETGIGRR
jgi:hypothetical protein